MQGNPSYRLIMRRGPQPNQVFELNEDVSNIGRDITNEIVINDREVSRHHLRFMKGADGVTLEDLGSTNGTFINGKRLMGAQALKNGDMIGLGETVSLQFEVAGAGASAGASSQPPNIQSQATMQSPSEQVAEEMFKPPQRQQSQPASDNPYQAPSQPQPQQPSYADPAPQYQAPAQQAQPESFQSTGDDTNYQGGQQDAYYAPAAAYGPPPPGYDYDPYAVREEEGGGIGQWLLIGCLSLLLLCCCMSVVLAVAVDTFCLYDDIPFLVDILEALINRAPTC